MTPHEQSVPPCICGDPQCRIPYGECHCGCGGRVPIADRNHTKKRFFIGRPIRYISEHGPKKLPPLEEAHPFKIEGVYCRLIQLTLGFYTIVWESDYVRLMRSKWWSHRGNNGKMYAIRKEYDHGKWINIFMANEVMGPPPEGKIWDHKSGEPLDNRQANFRPASKKENTRSSCLSRGNKTGYKGVSETRSGRFEAHIRVDGNLIYLGTFDTPELASEAYWDAAQKYFGEFARLK